MAKFPIAIDATRLFFRYLLIPGVTDALTDARQVQVVRDVGECGLLGQL